MTEIDRPAGLRLIRVVLEQLANPSYPGVNGTCYQCPFATEPLEASGAIAPWNTIANDPTEAYFRCLLPGRDPTKVAWGEHAPCSEQEWSNAALGVLASAEVALNAASAAADLLAGRSEAVALELPPVDPRAETWAV